jgi:hypothetical protein
MQRLVFRSLALASDNQEQYFSGCKVPINVKFSENMKFENNWQGKTKLKDTLKAGIKVL